MEDRSIGRFFLWILVACIGLLLLLSVTGCSSSTGFKRDQLICMGFCWEAETDAQQTTGTNKPKHKEEKDNG